VFIQTPESRVVRLPQPHQKVGGLHVAKHFFDRAQNLRQRFSA
jgi:hypothetical protein